MDTRFKRRKAVSAVDTELPEDDTNIDLCFKSAQTGADIVPTTISINDANERIQETLRYLSVATIVDEETAAKLKESNRLLAIEYEKEKVYDEDLKETQVAIILLQNRLAKQEADISSLRDVLTMNEQKINEHAAEHDELLKARSILNDTLEGFKDPITHEVAGPPYLTKTGHVKLIFNALILFFQI